MNNSIKYPRLELSEIVSAMILCRDNATELLEESSILLEARREARTFTLIHSASEELAKFFIFEIAGRRIANGNPPNWKRFWQRLRNHDSKIAQIEVRLRYLIECGSVEIDKNIAIDGLAVMLDYGLAPRNGSLYVEKRPDGHFRKPSDIDWSIPISAMREAARALLCAANALVSDPKLIEAKLSEPVEKDEKEAILSVFEHVVERAKSAGLTKEEVLNFFERSTSK